MVVEGDDDLLSLAQPTDGSGHPAAHLCHFVGSCGARARIGERFAERRRGASSVGFGPDDVVKGDDAEEGDLAQGLLELGLGCLQLGGQLGLGR